MMMITPSTVFVKPFWQAVTNWIGMRNLTGYLCENVDAYSDTITHFDFDPEDGGEKVIALTIDDGLCRGGGGDASSSDSLVKEVVDCLKRHGDSHATFFVCSDYLMAESPALQQDTIQLLLSNGHELGNHLEEDKSFYYNRLSKDEFRSILRKTNSILKELELQYDSNSNDLEQARTTTAVTINHHHRWFRAPQGLLSNEMAEVLKEESETKDTTTITHALGDCYCDDWRFAQDVDGKDEPSRKEMMQHVSNIMLSQVQPGSIAILHMPQRGFREGTLDALEFFLTGLDERGYKCVNLTELQQQQSIRLSAKRKQQQQLKQQQQDTQQQQEEEINRTDSAGTTSESFSSSPSS